MDKVKAPILIKKGAEANLYLTEWHGRKVVIKKRLAKKYRPSRLDNQIRTYRTTHEAQIMHEAKNAGVPTPTIFLVDMKKTTIIMEFIDGKQIKRLFSNISVDKRKKICFKIGELVGRLHEYGIIHGDLTTSNMILNSEGKIFFVDFGLCEKTKELEAKGVDLHLMKRALQSTHFDFADECFKAIIDGYAQVVGSDTVKNVLDKISEIEKRGRYVAERKEGN
jgi:TP53 regulating kinase-like protein